MKRKPRQIDLNYCEYNLTTHKDTKGGFFLPPEEDVPVPIEPAETAVVEQIEGLQCKHCPSIDLDLNYYKHYKAQVCNACKLAMPDSYSLLTKTECREDYLLTDSELRDSSRLPHWIKPNPHKSTYSNMLLYLRAQVEEFAWEKWGGPEKLDEEFQRRENEKVKRKDMKFKKKLLELRKKTRTTLWSKNQLGLQNQVDHQHVYGSPKSRGDEQVQTCTICNLELCFEEL